MAHAVVIGAGIAGLASALALARSGREVILLEDGAEPAPTNRGRIAGAAFDRYSSMVFAGDNRTFSVAFGVLPDDRPLARALRTPAGFDAAARCRTWGHGSIPNGRTRSPTCT